MEDKDRRLNDGLVSMSQGLFCFSRPKMQQSQPGNDGGIPEIRATPSDQLAKERKGSIAYTPMMESVDKKQRE